MEDSLADGIIELLPSWVVLAFMTTGLLCVIVAIATKIVHSFWRDENINNIAESVDRLDRGQDDIIEILKEISIKIK